MIKKGHIISCIITLVSGTLAHFLFEFSGENPFVGAVCPVNESTWEHLKLLYTPMFICTVFEFFIYNRPSVVAVRALCANLGVVSIVVLFYTYTGIVGTNFLVVDIATFFVSVIFAYVLSYRLMKKRIFESRRSVVIGWACLVGVLGMFVVFTFYPPELALFMESSSGTYGIVS